MKRSAHRLPFCIRRWGTALALVALLAFASGAAGLAHRVLAHSGGGSAAAGHVHAQGSTPCDSTPAEAPSDEESHDCQVCTLLAAGFTPAATPDAVPALWPNDLQPRVAAFAAPSAAPAALPPARGPPSRSV